MTAEGYVTTAQGQVAIEARGAYLSPRSLGELTNYVHDLRDCIHD